MRSWKPGTLASPPRRSCLHSSQGWETCLPLTCTKEVSTPPLLSYSPKLFWDQKQRRRYHCGFSLGWMHRAWAIFPFAAFLCQPTWRDTSLSRASLLLPGKLSQLFYHSHILQTDEEFLHCLFLLKFFTKSFYICSACEKILLPVLKIWNSSSCNGISCTLHLPSLIGAVWLWIVLSLTRAKSESVSYQ